MSYVFVDNHKDYLARELQLRQKRRPLYSLRAFSRDLGLSPSTLSDFLNDRIGFSKGRINQLGSTIGLSIEQKAHWADLVNIEFGRSPNLKKTSRLRIDSRLKAEKNAVSLDEFKAISEWHHFAFLELIEMNATKYSDLTVAAKALKISVPMMRNSVERLLALKLLNQEGRVYKVDANTQIGNAAPSEAIRHFHTQILNKATQAIEEQKMEERFMSSTMIGLPQDKVDAVKEELKSLAYKVLEPYVEQSKNQPKDKLYCLSIQFFNLLNEGKKS